MQVEIGGADYYQFLVARQFSVGKAAEGWRSQALVPVMHRHGSDRKHLTRTRMRGATVF